MGLVTVRGMEQVGLEAVSPQVIGKQTLTGLPGALFSASLPVTDQAGWDRTLPYQQVFTAANYVLSPVVGMDGQRGGIEGHSTLLGACWYAGGSSPHPKELSEPCF